MRLLLEELEPRVVLSADLKVALGLANGSIANRPIVLNTEQEPNDTLADANAITLDGFGFPLPLANTAGGSVAGQPSIVFPGPWRDFQSAYVQGDLDHGPSGTDLDYFTFTTDANRVITLNFYGAAVQQGALPVLLNASGEVIAQASTTDWDDDGTPDAATIEYTSEAGGQFFVQVGPATSPSAGEPSEYVLTVSTVRTAPAREQEPNDTQEQANSIAWEANGWWPPVLAASPASTDVNMPIRFGWGVHGLITGNLDGTADVPDTDWFSFSAGAERLITLSLDGAAVQDGAVPTLVDANGQIVASAETYDWDGDGQSDYVTLSHYSRAGGDFFVHVGPGADANGDGSTNYVLNVTVQPDPYNEHEPNDTQTSANPIELSLPYQIAGPIPLGQSDGQVIWPGQGDPSQYGWINGQMNGDDPSVVDVDYFSLDLQTERHVQVNVSAYQSANIDRIALLDAVGNELAADADASDGLRLDFTTSAAGAYYVLVQGHPAAPSTDLPPSTGNGIAYPISSYYQVYVTVTPPAPPEQGPDEYEPNNTIDTANWLELEYLPTFAPGLELRGADVHGIAGGPSNDQDVFEFDAYAGETVQVGIDDTRLANGAVVHVAVFDSEGHQVGHAKGNGVVFEPADDDDYFVVVTVKNAGDQLVDYHLGVLAQGYSDPDDEDAGDELNSPPLQVTLSPGGTYGYTDADGDAVTVVFNGKAGQAVITFTGSDADGSDIGSIVIQGTRNGSTLSVQTDGAAEVGAIDIQGLVRHGRASGKFAAVDIDGNLGLLTSNINLQKVLIDGVLGELHAHGLTVNKLQASVFNLALADALLRRHDIEHDNMMAALLFTDG